MSRLCRVAAATVVALAAGNAGASLRHQLEAIRAITSAITIVSPPSGASVSGTVSVRARLDGEAGLKHFVIDGQSFAGTREGWSTYYRLSWNTEQFTDGNHEITAKAYYTSCVGGVFGYRCYETYSVVSSPISATVANAPRIVISGVSHGEVRNAIPVDVCYSATDANLVSDEGVLDGVPFRGCTVAFTAGEHVLTVTASDSAGNTANAEARFVIDRSPPTVGIESPSAGALVGAQAVEVVAAATDDHGVASVRANGTELMVAADGRYRGFVPLAEGPNEIVVTSTDLAGNATSTVVSVVSDTLPPTFSVATPLDGSRVRSTSVNVAVEAEDLHGVAAVSANGVAGMLWPDGLFHASVDLSQGTNVITVTATDRAGNAGTLVLSVLHDTTPPGLFVDTPVEGEHVGGSVHVAGRAQDVDRVSVTINGRPASVAADGSFQGQLQFSGGLQRITVLATDTAGNRSSIVRSVHVSAPIGAPVLFSHDAAGNLTGIYNVLSDPSNCGAVGNVCSVAIPGSNCCGNGFCGMLRDGQCNDLASDPWNCGVPGRVCQGVAGGAGVCVGGACAIACDAGFVLFGGACIDVTSNVQSCGTAGTLCGGTANGSPRCVGGSCMIDCNAGYTMSYGQCVDLDTDPTHCGPDWTVCQSGEPHAVDTCTKGVCSFRCEAPYVPDALGHCVDLATDPRNCGAIGTLCPGTADGTALCTAGTCSRLVGVPAVSTVNGVAAPGRIFAMQYTTGLSITGVNLDQVTSVELEDWGADADWRLTQSTPRDTGVSAGSVSFAKTATTISISGDDLGFMPRLMFRRWYKVRLHYVSAGQDRFTESDVAVSFDWRDSSLLPPPMITGVRRLRVVEDVRYDAESGFVATGEHDPTHDDPPAIAVLGEYSSEYRILSISHDGVWIQPHARLAHVAPHEAQWHVLVYPYDNRPLDRVHVGIDDVMLLGDGFDQEGVAYLSYPAGTPVSTSLGSGPWLSSLDLYGEPIADESTAFIELTTLSGTAVTPWPLKWLAPPEITAVQLEGSTECVDVLGRSDYPPNVPGIWSRGSGRTPACRVCPQSATYDVELAVAGTSLVGVDSVTLLGPDGAMETLSAATGPSPGPNEYLVVDGEHIRVHLSPGGVPRDLAVLADGRGEAYPGKRTLKVNTGGGSASVDLHAVPPSAPGIIGGNVLGPTGYVYPRFIATGRVNAACSEAAGGCAGTRTFVIETRNVALQDIAEVALIPGSDPWSRIAPVVISPSYTSLDPTHVLLTTLVGAEGLQPHIVAITLNDGSVMRSGFQVSAAIAPRTVGGSGGGSTPPDPVSSPATPLLPALPPLPPGGDCSNSLCP